MEDTPTEPEDSSLSPQSPKPEDVLLQPKKKNNRPYKGIKKFMVNGLVRKDSSFYVSQKEWNDQNLRQPIKKKEYIMLVAPSQSGKTTRVLEFCEELKGGNEYFPVYIDMSFIKSDILAHRGAFLNESQLSDRFWQSLVEKFNKELSPKNQIDHTQIKKFDQLFLPKNKQYFDQKKCVLFFDEIDALTLLDMFDTMGKNVREGFLDELPSLKQLNVKSPDQTTLQSCIGITNHIGTYLKTGIGSPFNISTPYDVDYFTEVQASKLREEYETQEQVNVPKTIKDEIYESTAGAPGQFVMLAASFHDLREPSDDEKAITSMVALHNQFPA